MNFYNFSSAYMLYKFLKKHRKSSFVAILLFMFFSYDGSRNKLLGYLDENIPSLSSLVNRIGSNSYVNEKNSLDEDFLIQGTPPGLSEQILYRKGYVVSYNSDTRQPNWVAWHLTREHTYGDIPRQQKFIEDTDVPLPRPELSDYRGSGYDRGHMCPAGDNKWDRQAMYESFYLTNMCPQHPSLNSGLWNQFEQQCREWARKYGSLYIVCGPLFLNQKHRTIGSNKIIVPEAFFKVVLCTSREGHGFGIICRNTDGQRKRDLYYNSIDEIERITGIDFFPSLSAAEEESIESHINYNFWKDER